MCLRVLRFLLVGLDVELGYVVIFFFKQKTAYEMRISDWSSDVCSSDLAHGLVLELSASVLAIIRRCLQTGRRAHTPCQWVLQTRRRQPLLRSGFPEQFCHAEGRRNALRSWPAGRSARKEGFREQGKQSGRASCREGVGQDW